MRIYLLKTPEFSEVEFQNIYNLLETFKGPLEFLKVNLDFDKEMFPFLKKIYPDFTIKDKSDIKRSEFNNELSTRLSWREIFSLCTYYRDTFSIDPIDFVVVLTNRSNDLTWFSSFDEMRNIFVHTNEWDLFTNANPKYPIAYQIVENVMQFLMKIDIENPHNPYMHMRPKGCMNDFCHNKEEVILKLQTANICDTCLDKIRFENIDNDIIEQVFRIFEGVRNELIFKRRPKAQNISIQLPITVTNRNEIFIGNLKIGLTPIRKTLYLFFLKDKLTNENGILFNHLSNFNLQLLDIYRQVAVEGEMDKLEVRVNSLVNPLENRFSMEKSKINSRISAILGKELATDYIIDGQRLKPFKINISKNLIQFQQ
jgi:hypothetical protein